MEVHPDQIELRTLTLDLNHDEAGVIGTALVKYVLALHVQHPSPRTPVIERMIDEATAVLRRLDEATA